MAAIFWTHGAGETGRKNGRQDQRFHVRAFGNRWVTGEDLSMRAFDWALARPDTESKADREQDGNTTRRKAALD